MPTLTIQDTEFLFDRIPQEQDFKESLWGAADQLRASAKLKSSEYASNRFDAITPQAEAEYEAGKDSRNAETLKQIYLRLCGYYLPEAARFTTLLNLPGQANGVKAVRDAMRAFEEANPDAGIELPKNDYEKIPDATLLYMTALIDPPVTLEPDRGSTASVTLVIDPPLDGGQCSASR